MIDTVKPLAAKAKLALSRAEILAAMGYEEVKGAANAIPVVVELPEPSDSSAVSILGKRVGQSVIGRWYRRSPVRMAMQLGEPLLQGYARKHPATLIAIGAGTGALLRVLKPWRLLSVATVVGLVLKSSDITGAVVEWVTKARKVHNRSSPRLQGSDAPNTLGNSDRR